MLYDHLFNVNPKKIINPLPPLQLLCVIKMVGTVVFVVVVVVVKLISKKLITELLNLFRKALQGFIPPERYIYPTYSSSDSSSNNLRNFKYSDRFHSSKKQPMSRNAQVQRNILSFVLFLSLAALLSVFIVVY